MSTPRIESASLDMLRAVHLGDLRVGTLGLALGYARGLALSRASTGLTVTSVALRVHDVDDSKDVGEKE